MNLKQLRWRRMPMGGFLPILLASAAMPFVFAMWVVKRAKS
jgi:hypothetical protein